VKISKQTVPCEHPTSHQDQPFETNHSNWFSTLELHLFCWFLLQIAWKTKYPLCNKQNTKLTKLSSLQNKKINKVWLLMNKFLTFCLVLYPRYKAPSWRLQHRFSAYSSLLIVFCVLRIMKRGFKVYLARNWTGLGLGDGEWRWLRRRVGEKIGDNRRDQWRHSEE
jgi:hypothetical protein